MSNIIEVENLNAGYGNTHILFDVSLNVDGGILKYWFVVFSLGIGVWMVGFWVLGIGCC
ncbi:MAG: hypothetical protein QXI52_01295 [Nitrososphaerota archaeon]